MNSREISENILSAIRIPQVSPLLPSDLHNKIRGVVYGNALGDAVGLRTEFMKSSKAAKVWAGRPLGILGWKVRKFPEGDWTDDTDQLLVILQSFLELRCVSQLNIAKRLLDWMNHGFPEFGDSSGVGCGKTVRTVLRSDGFLSDPFAVAFQVWVNGKLDLAANGALMRTSILGIINFQDLAQVIKNTIDVATITHVDPRCVASCVASTSFIALMLQGHEFMSAYELAVEISCRFIRIYTEILENLVSQRCGAAEVEAFNKIKEIFAAERLEAVLRSRFEELLPLDGKDMGYTYKCLGCCFWAVGEMNWEEAMKRIISQGGDADTNAAAAGALLGCKISAECLPEIYKQLKYFDWLESHTTQVINLL